MPGPLNGWRFIVGEGDLTATEETLAVAHGLPATPTFVLLQDSTGAALDWTADSTTLTISQLTAAAATVSYMASVE